MRVSSLHDFPAVTDDCHTKQASAEDKQRGWFRGALGWAFGVQLLDLSHTLLK